MSKKLICILVLLILILGVSLRSYHFNSFPKYGQTQDEAAWTWLGMSLLSSGQPASWSWLSIYQENHIYKQFSINQDNFRIITPWLDNPPLFSFIPGSFAMLSQQKIFAPYSLSIIRAPMLILGLINMLLLFLLARKVSLKTGFFSLLIFASAPFFVFPSRMVLAENLLITFFLLNLVALESFLNKKKSSKNLSFLIILSCSFLAILTKLTGMAIALFNIFVLLNNRKTQEALKVIFVLFLAIISFTIYGIIYDFPLFISAIAYNSLNRFNGYNFPEKFLTTFNITSGDRFFDGWKIFCLISLGNLVNQKSKTLKRIFTQLIFYLLLLTVAVPENTHFAWYVYPIYPLLAISAGSFIENIFKKQSLAGSLLLIFILLIPQLIIISQQNFLALNSNIFRSFIIFLALIFIIFWKFKPKTLPYFSLSLVFIFNILVVLSF